MPGGVIYVLLGLDKIVPSLLTTAIPILLALPSMPSARNYYIYINKSLNSKYERVNRGLRLGRYN